MNEKRKNTRYHAFAHAKIEGIPGEEILLKDLSITGCCVESTTHLEIKLNSRYKIAILPEVASGIGDFDVLAESKWSRTRDYSCEIGFAILESPKGRLFQRYVDYLSWRAEAGSFSGSTIV
ncbi:MAG: PilZ domain-containing protein [Treponema sp.]|jgi:hypothetical protein|nr:PilZ domain-containing protein [Treponema sp.]